MLYVLYTAAACCLLPLPLLQGEPLEGAADCLLLLPPLLLQDEPLDACGTAAAFAQLAASINEAEAAAGKPAKSVDEVAMGFVRVANETMCRPIRCVDIAAAADSAAADANASGGVWC